MLLTLEGLDFSGKTTLAAGLKRQLEADGRKVTVCRAPGGTELGAHLREIVLNAAIPVKSLWARQLLFLADHAELCETVIMPALARGEIVIADRLFHSTLVYAHYGYGLNRERIEQLIAHTCPAVVHEQERVLLLTLDMHCFDQRRAKTGARDQGDGGKRAFYHLIANGYMREYVRAQRWRAVNANLSAEDVLEQALDVIEGWL